MKSILAAVLLTLVPAAALADSNTGGLRGFVREHSYAEPPVADKPVAGATIYIWDGYTEIISKTDAHGFYVIFGLAPGFYEVTADNGAYTQNPFISTRNICIHAGNVSDVNLEVVPRLVADYTYSEAIKERYHKRFQPNTSQTADLYSIGEC